MTGAGTDADDPAADDAGMVSVVSHPDDDGVYRVQLELGPDDAVALDDWTGQQWATYVIRMTVEAEYDAATIAQLRATGLDLDSTIGLVTGMREARRAIREAAGLDSPVPGLALVPGVSAATRGPFLTLWWHDRQIGQWDPTHARHHAAAVLDILEAAHLDEIYRRTLIDVAGLDPHIAEKIVHDLDNHREEQSS